MRKKLIEVALPLEAINVASAKEKSIRHGHPSTLHLWWARRPLAACRAVLFASLVDDPSSQPEQFPTEEEQERERRRLFGIIEDLVKWENSTNEQVLEAARAEIRKSCGDNPPPVLDPFCGGGSIPLEAQRLGLEAHASDLNPVAVLITKALIEIPLKFAGREPVNPDWQKKPPAEKALTTWKGAAGLAEDVRWYGRWMRDEAKKRIGHLYPKVAVTEEMARERADLQALVGQELIVIAWQWARTVQCSNPACKAEMPLVKSFWLSKKKNHKAWVEPVPTADRKTVRFEVWIGSGKPSIEGTVGRSGATCVCCGSHVSLDHVRSESKSGRMSNKLMAVVADGIQSRVYLPTIAKHESVAVSATAEGVPETTLPETALGFRVQLYGMSKHRDLFTMRQLSALTAFSDLVSEVSDLAFRDVVAAGLPNDALGLADGSGGARAYAEALAVYLALSTSKSAAFNCSLSRWRSGEDKSAPAFGRHVISMVWDFAEVNPFGGAGGDLLGIIEGAAKVLGRTVPRAKGVAKQQDAVASVNGVVQPVLCTDPPYYDNIGYADLADFFYVWLRRTLHEIYPGLFLGILTPKDQELVAAPHRFSGDKAKAQQYFERGLGQVFRNMRKTHHPEYPCSLFYAFKQSEEDDDQAPDVEVEEPQAGLRASTGWETMLEGLIGAEFMITGTWPVRTEGQTRLRAMGSNALASSVVLVCRPRPVDARPATRRDFLTALKRELPDALKKLQHGNIAPVDLAQAAIGPGMAIFSRYKQVVESNGQPMTVRTALQFINQALDEILTEQDSEYDAHTRFALAWYEQFALTEGAFGDADVLARAKDCSLTGLVEAGVLSSRAGKVRLLRRDELAENWSPPAGRQPYVWEVTQHLIRALEKGGESGAADILRQVGSVGETARDLAYRLYNTCERKKWAEEARAYNGLVIAWPHIQQLASQQPPSTPQQGTLYD